MKYIDKFLKWLNTDRNTFMTYVLTLATVYIMVDRIVELMLLFFSGIGLSYWGPIAYTFAIACPIFAFLFSGASQFAKSNKLKITYLYLYCIALYVIGISMAVQWINGGLWLLFLSVPNYAEIVMDVPELIKPAFQAISLYLPLVTFYPLFKWLFTVVNDNKDIKDGIVDYGGIDLSDQTVGTGPYTCEVVLCKDKTTGKLAKIPEIRRFEPALIVGISGTGKTAMVFEPLIARDIEKKYFFKEVSKEMGFTALKTGLAHLNSPFSNDYLNENFNLNMLTANSGKESVYKAYMKKMIYFDSGKTIYRDLGLTYISPDIESINNMVSVAKNYNIPVNLVDPNDSNSPGLNPFVFDNPSDTAIAISTVLKGMYGTQHSDEEVTFRENVASQAIENLSILLKEMYPRLHDGLLPTLEDMLKMLNNFDLIEEMSKLMEADPELSEQYEIQIGYFKKYFYAQSDSRKDTERFVYAAINELDSLLRIKNIRSILCNRTNNLNFDEILSRGEITMLCTRRGDLGATMHKAFGLFFILLMQFSVLRRPGNEKSRLPHFFYVDDFPDYLCSATQALYTIYRKYRVGTIISAQNLMQLGVHGKSQYRESIMANATTKLVFGGVTREECDIWEKEFNDHREWKYTVNYDTDKVKYDSKFNGPKWDWKENIKSGKLKSLKFKDCAYVMKNVKGANIYGDGKVDFLESKYKEVHSSKVYDFAKFTSGITEEEKPKNTHKVSKLSNTEFEKDARGDIDPIKTDEADSNYLFDNEDAIIVNLKRGNPNG